MPFENQDITLTVPEGAGPGEVRIVIGVELPPPLDTYLYKGVSRFAGAILFRQETDDEFLFIGLVNNEAGGTETGLTIQLGGVRNGVVVEDNPGEPSGGTWFFNASDFVGHTHRGGSVTLPHVDIVGGEFDAFLVLHQLNGTLWSFANTFFIKNGPANDAIARWLLQADATMFWGDGQVTADCFIRRDAVQQLLIGPAIRVPNGINSPRMRIVEDFRDGPDTGLPGTAYGPLSFTNGVAFTAPPSGLVSVEIEAEIRLDPTAARIVYMGYEIRTGASLGASGTLIKSAEDRKAAIIGISGGVVNRSKSSSTSLVGTTGELIPGNIYHVRLMSRISTASSASVEIALTRITVTPSP